MDRIARSLVAAVAFAALVTATASAGTLDGSTGFGGVPGYVPQVPISQLARAATWFDPSRLHVSSTISVGSGWGSGTSALQVTTLSYAFKAPLSMSVSVGNSWGRGFSSTGGNSMFLEGLNLNYRPTANMQFNIQYRDLRSPLQLSPYDYRYGYRNGWGP